MLTPDEMRAKVQPLVGQVGSAAVLGALISPSDVIAVLDTLRGARGEADLLRRTIEKWEADFPCDGGCVEYPEEDCTRHGRRPRDLWDRIDRLSRENAAVARVRALCDKADAEAFDLDYIEGMGGLTTDEVRAALDREACPFCTREAQAECESTGGRCSGEDEIDAVLDDRPDLNAHEALIAGLGEAQAEVESLTREAERTAALWREEHERAVRLRERSDKAEAAIARVRALLSDEWGPLSDDGERCALCRRKWSKHGGGDEHHHRASSGIAGIARIVLATLDGEA